MQLIGESSTQTTPAGASLFEAPERRSITGPADELAQAT